MSSEQSPMIIYRSTDCQLKIDVRLDEETVWLSINQMAKLFQRDKSVISRHIKNIYAEGEIEENSTVANFATVQNEGHRKVERNVTYYNLDVIIAVGYRVKSSQGTQFRIWATERLKEYLQKGFTLNDEFLQNMGGGLYWKEFVDELERGRKSLFGYPEENEQEAEGRGWEQ